ncbi:MAG TPA: flagellar hook-basal body complex protein [Candidatus Baltobacteraceae bacterium]|nr:flagellar hook-basal body complex protein [Candidatus Baltobacteraceae bacterium]
MGFDSLFTGISGLDAYQSQIDMISNNIANVGTVGFKGQDMTFADLFYQSQGFASGPTQTNGGVDPMQTGLGVKVNSISTDFTQGGLETTGVNTDLAINGDGFFILRNTDGSGQPVYTRDGAFSLNSNGVLYDPASGLAVQGYMADSNGVVNSSGTPGTISIPIGLQMQATATGGPNAVKLGPQNDQNFDMSFGGSLDQTQFSVAVAGGTPTSKVITTTIYDSLGNAHQATITFTPDATGATPASQVTNNAGGDINGATTVSGSANQNDTITITSNGPGLGYKITDSLGNSTTATAGQNVTMGGATFTLATPEPAAGNVSTVTVTAATTGLPATVNNASGTAVAPATRWKYTVSFADGTAASTSSGDVFFDQNGQFINTSSSPTGTPVHATGGAPSAADGNALVVSAWPAGDASTQPQTIGLDFSNMAALAGTPTANVLAQDGYAAGTLSNITVGQDGSVVGSFTNGQQKTLAQVALATFQNEGGLTRAGGNFFQESANSGLAQVGSANSGRYGAIIAGSLEESNVSLADEFTKMIVAQRAFEANTRGISTADQNMQDVINMRASEN